MQRAMVLVAGLTIISGLSLLWTAFSGDRLAILTFIGFGSLALIAAVTLYRRASPVWISRLGRFIGIPVFGLLRVGNLLFIYPAV